MKRTVVTVYSRHGCHLCEDAIQTLKPLSQELQFELDIEYIEGNQDLEQRYGEQIPVIHIDGIHHDFWRVDSERFRTSLDKHRQRQ